MQIYDTEFEGMRLSMLAKQYSEISTNNGKFIFWADEEKNEFSHGTWLFDDETYNKIIGSSFKMQFILLLNNFIEYRAINNKFPNKEGIVSFGYEKLEIEWVKIGEAEKLKERLKCIQANIT